MEIRREFYLEKRIAHQKTQANGGQFQRTLSFGVAPAALPEGGAFSLPDL